MTVKKLQGKRHLGRVKSSPRLIKFADSLNLEHQIATVNVLHDKKQTVLQRE